MKETKKSKTMAILGKYYHGIPKEMLVEMTDQSPDGLRGRISELRKEGINIISFRKEFTCYKIERKPYKTIGKPAKKTAIDICAGDIKGLTAEWTVKEENWLRENIFSVPFKKVVSHLGRPYDEVKFKCEYMGMIWRDRIHKTDGSIEKV